MSRIDWIIARRLSARIGMTLFVFFGLLALVESLDTYRFKALTQLGGPLLALEAIISGAGRNLIGTLPVTVLIGTIIGVLDLQARRELTIIKSSGISIWRVLRYPLIGAALLGLVAAFGADTLAIEFNRALPTRSAATGGEIWLEQHNRNGDYILHADHSQKDGTALTAITVFFTGSSGRDRIEAASATLAAGKWKLSGVVRYQLDLAPRYMADYDLPTTTTAGDMQVRLTSVRDLTFAELLEAVTKNVADPVLRASAITSLLRLLALPALLAGSVLIGFAFTSGYRRTNKYGGTVLYGIVLGFVVYVVTELANRSGFAGVLDPTFAAAGPAFVAIVIGLTVLLYKEDGRA
jgi:lipopolysaccharide export system permease protein